MNIKVDTTHVAEFMGVKVPPSPYLNETRATRINEGRYEGQEIAGALHVVREDDRVLEMGAGLGVVGAIVQTNAKPAAMTSYEANPNMIEHIEALYALNRIKSKIQLHNKVLLSTPDRPETVDFFLQNSILASSLSDTNKRKTTPVSVPTASYDEVCKRFKPTVLIMDIEGAELDFLRNADLSDLRAVVIEFHPGVYGVAGMRECKDILNAAGFKSVPEVSTRMVWTAERIGPAMDSADTRPLAGKGWSRTLKTVKKAVVVPPLEGGLVQASGVLDSKGKYIEEGALWRGVRSISTAPAAPKKKEKLAGTWIWGGPLWLHFGHFLVESTPRLWALDHADEKIDGVIFTPKRPRNAARVKRWQWSLFNQIMPGVKVEIVAEPTEVEKLIVPGQGFGLGLISAGTPEYRASMRKRFAQGIEPKGAENIYISRAAFKTTRGSLVGEVELERRLEAEGYTIFHPEQHSIEDQIAQYKAAKQIIASEGSAIHMLAMVAEPHQRVAIVVRRRSKATDFIETHLKSFAGIQALSIDALIRNWMPEGESRPRHSLGEIDFPKLQSALQAAGYIGKSAPWKNLEEAEVMELLGESYRIV